MLFLRNRNSQSAELRPRLHTPFYCLFYLHFNIFSAMYVVPCHHGMSRSRIADGGTASNMEGSCE